MPKVAAAEAAVSAYEQAIDIVRGHYPLDIFPEGESAEAKAAKMARVTCDNIREEHTKLKEVALAAKGKA